MMNKPASHGGIIILLSFAVAYVLTMIPLSDSMKIYRPEWVTLVLIYWCLALPNRVGVFTGWTVGLMLDIVYGSLMGQYALALSIIAFISYKLHIRIRLYPLLQQSLIVLLLVTLSQLIVLWTKGVTGQVAGGWSYWYSSLISMLVWPWLFYLLRTIRRAYGVN